MTEQICRLCEEVKSLSEFQFRTDTQKYRTDCNECRQHRQRLVRYGLTREEYDDLFIAQDGRCAICDRRARGRWDMLVVDHDHETGTVRGLLCASCNYGLGMLGDTLERIESARVYLQRPGRL